MNKKTFYIKDLMEQKELSSVSFIGKKRVEKELSIHNKKSNFNRPLIAKLISENSSDINSGTDKPFSLSNDRTQGSLSEQKRLMRYINALEKDNKNKKILEKASDQSIRIAFDDQMTERGYIDRQEKLVVINPRAEQENNVDTLIYGISKILED